jgi:hypothetical protein
MKKLRVARPITLPAFAILAILAASGHAKKPSPPPEPTVTVAGVIAAEGDPKAIRVTFDSSLDFDYPGDATDGLEFISNPDYPPSVKIVYSAPPRTHLRYYYCVHKDHEDSPDLICTDDSHSPDYYYCLTISDGIPNHKSSRHTDHVTFPAGSPWNISSKQTMSVVKEGTLSIETTYDVTQ